MGKGGKGKEREKRTVTNWTWTLTVVFASKEWAITSMLAPEHRALGLAPVQRFPELNWMNPSPANNLRERVRESKERVKRRESIRFSVRPDIGSNSTIRRSREINGLIRRRIRRRERKRNSTRNKRGGRRRRGGARRRGESRGGRRSRSRNGSRRGSRRRSGGGGGGGGRGRDESRGGSGRGNGVGRRDRGGRRDGARSCTTIVFDTALGKGAVEGGGGERERIDVTHPFGEGPSEDISISKAERKRDVRNRRKHGENDEESAYKVLSSKSCISSGIVPERLFPFKFK